MKTSGNYFKITIDGNLVMGADYKERSEIKKSVREHTAYSRVKKTQFKTEKAAKKTLNTIPADIRKWLIVCEGFDIISF